MTTAIASINYLDSLRPHARSDRAEVKLSKRFSENALDMK
jgi:hypothetical protein